MAKQDKGGSRQEGGGRKPRAQRMSEDAQAQFRQRQLRPDEAGESKAGSPLRGSRDEGDRVMLPLSPRLARVARKLADAAGMSVREYLLELIQDVLIGQSRRGRDRYTPEFTHTGESRVATWRPEGGKPEDGRERRQWPEARQDSGFRRREGTGAGRGERSGGFRRRQEGDREAGEKRGGFRRPEENASEGGEQKGGFRRRQGSTSAGAGGKEKKTGFRRREGGTGAGSKASSANGRRSLRSGKARGKGRGGKPPAGKRRGS